MFSKDNIRMTVSDADEPITTRKVQVGDEVGLYVENDDKEIAIEATEVSDGVIYGRIMYFQSLTEEYKGLHVGQIVEFTEANVANHRV